MAVDKLVDSGVLDAALEDIADVIRNKTGISGTFDFPSPNDLADAIDFYLMMPTGTKSITENGTGIDVASYSKVDVNVSGGGGIDFDDYIESNPDFPDGTITFLGTSIRAYAMAYCDSTHDWKIVAPNATFVDHNAFRECRYLTEAHFPSLTSYGATSYIFYMPVSGVKKLSLLDWGKCDLRSNLFSYASNLKTLILRKTTIATVNNVNTFSGTPFANGGSGGTIYIPKALYDHLGDGTSNDYKAATNWSTVDGYGTITWAKIEGSPYEL